jgi:hypothetical protein
MEHLDPSIFMYVEHKDQRYDTAGDYYKLKGQLVDNAQVNMFKISKMKRKEYEFLVAVHEFIEQFLTEVRGIKEEDITDFDINSNSPDPGTDPNAPYHKEHMFSTKVEKMICEELGLDWDEYDTSFEALEYGPKQG